MREGIIDTLGVEHDPSIFSEAARLLRPCQRLLVLTGAGFSADAGVPTFRGADGLWNDEELMHLASAQGFAEDSERVWEWYRDRRYHISTCEPHGGQRSLALLQKHFLGRVLVATTNEDDLLDRAGVQHVVHVHGSLFDTICSAGCGWHARDTDDNGFSFLPCAHCGAPVRPGSVWFGEQVSPSTLERIERYRADGCIVIGSSSLVQPVSSIPADIAVSGRPVIEINAGETPLSALAAVCLRGQALDTLPHLVDLLTSRTVQEQHRRDSNEDD